MENTYWKKNLRYITILLSLWFIVSFGCGILFVEQLNTIQIGGFKLGFWFAQQGSIFGFVAIIFTYIYLGEQTRSNTKQINDGTSILDLIAVGLSFSLYIGIAIWSRAGSTKEFYVAGGGVHPIANGMATAADWMSAASFISMAGIISFGGYDGSCTSWAGQGVMYYWPYY